MFNFKKFVALGMVATMVMGSAVTSFAADPGDPAEQTTPAASAITGEGSNIYVNKQVYKAELPTAGAVAALEYKVDVQGLVAATVADGIEVEEGAGILFANSDTKYSSESNAITVTNMSSIPISLSVSAVLTEDAGSDKYTGGYSTSEDFAKVNTDKTAGIFLGVAGSTEVEYKALNATAATVATVLPTAAQYYETTESGGVYDYDLPDDVTNIEFPKYEMVVKGAINRDVAETAFATVDPTDGSVTTKEMPTISLTFTPAAIKDWKEAVVVMDGDENFYVRKATGTDDNGGFGTTKPTAATINGKTIDVSKLGSNADGYVLFTWKDFYTAYGYTDEDKIPNADELYGILNSLYFTVDSVTYYVELK